MSSCIWKGRDEPRALRDRHDEDGCVDEHGNADPNCKGCQVCTRPHCIICGINHVYQRTCPECVAEVREALVEVRDLYWQLDDHALHGAHDGKLEAAREIPGGEAMVLLAPGSDGRAIALARERGEDVSHAKDERANELAVPLVALVGWEDDWRKIRRQPTDETASVGNAVAYLDEHLAWAAQYHDAFDSFVDELRAQRGHLEDVLHAGDRRAKAAPCMYCRGGRVERTYHPKTGFGDTYICLNRRCGKPYSKEQYALAVRAGYLAMSDRLTASDAAEVLGVTPGRIRVWGSRYPELKAGRNESGLWLYKVSALRARIEQSEIECGVEYA